MNSIPVAVTGQNTDARISAAWKQIRVPYFSYATAIGLFKNGINLILLIPVNRFARKIKCGKRKKLDGNVQIVDVNDHVHFPVDSYN